jgi:hypothetical protein
MLLEIIIKNHSKQSAFRYCVKQMLLEIIIKKPFKVVSVQVLCEADVTSNKK